MLTDPLSLGVRANVATGDLVEEIDFHLVSGPRDLAIIRKGDLADSKFTMSSNRLPSKENGKVPTARVLVRFDEVKFVDTLAQNVVQSIYIVNVVPNGGFATIENQQFVHAALQNFLKLSTDGSLNRINNGEG